MPENIPDTSRAFKIFGHRSAFSWVFGSFFSNSSNTAGLLAFILVSAVLYMYVAKLPVPDKLLDILLIIIGFYFGGMVAKRDMPNQRDLP
jgi:uncharacterized membrane protein